MYSWTIHLWISQRGNKMKASIVDLRYNMSEIRKALKQNEPVKIYYHGKLEGTIIPAQATQKTKKVEDHPFFGQHKTSKLSVTKTMDLLRSSRYQLNAKKR